MAENQGRFTETWDGLDENYMPVPPRTYALKGIYDIGPGRTSFALADFYNSGHLDLAADSAEGVAIFRADPNGDGGFQIFAGQRKRLSEQRL